MPLYDSDTPEGQSIVSVKLDGREVMYELFIKTANTDEGWLDVYEFTVNEQGQRRLKLSDWKPVGFYRQQREPIVTRHLGKVEVTVSDAASEPELVAIDPTT